MAKYEVLGDLFDDIADSIRTKTGEVAGIKAEDFPEEILKITTDPSGDTTATAADLLSPKTAYSKGQLITGTILTKTKSDITIANHVATVPSGYFATSPTIQASELTSGNLALESELNDRTNIDVVNYSTLSIQGMSAKSMAGSATPTSSVQEITPETGKLLNKVTVAAVPYSEEENILGGLTIEIL